MLVVIALLLLALGVHRYQACQKKGGKYSTVGAGGAEHSFDRRPLDERRKTDRASVAALFLIQLDHSQLAFAQWPIPHSTAEHDAAVQMIDTLLYAYTDRKASLRCSLEHLMLCRWEFSNPLLLWNTSGVRDLAQRCHGWPLLTVLTRQGLP
jgi:hypothetical protein